jgi:hypothetical protein
MEKASAKIKFKTEYNIFVSYAIRFRILDALANFSVYLIKDNLCNLERTTIEKSKS